MATKCYYCQDNSSLFDSEYLWGGRTDSSEVRVKAGCLSIDADVDNAAFTGKVSINYCPMCGREIAGGTVNEHDRTPINQ